jgi:FMN phosphatase YigB (HAD superfamily)
MIGAADNDKLLITDLDNTLYDWVEAYIPAFRAMVHVLAKITNLDEDAITESFKRVYSHHGSLEYPYCVEELDVLKQFDLPKEEFQRQFVWPARRAFRTTRKHRLKLYPHVKNTLRRLKNDKIIIVALTDSPLYPAGKRLRDLGIDKYFDCLISRTNLPMPDYAPDRIRKNSGVPTAGHVPIVQTLEPHQLKPTLHSFDIVRSFFRYHPESTYFVGDSLWKDVSLAQKIGINDIWARYGAHNNENNLKTLRRITHWSPEEELEYRTAKEKIKPTYEIDDFSEVEEIVEPRQMSLFDSKS